MSKEGDEEETPRSDDRTEDKAPSDDERSLVGPDEWEDPPEAQVISEFHKTPETMEDEDDNEFEDADLEAWIDHWKGRSAYKVLSVYHKDGAPYLDEAFVEGEPGTPDGDKTTGTKVEERPPKRPHPSPTIEKIKEIKVSPKKMPRKKEISSKGPERVIDITTLEFLAFTVIRALFPRRVRYAVKKEGLVDMDITIDDRDIIFNTNQLVFEFPEMSIWRLIFAYKGRPVIEMGRGVKNGIKFHRMRLVRVAFDMWLAERRKERRMKRERKKRERRIRDGK